MIEPQTRVAIVGCGQIARAHVAALAKIPAVSLVAVCDRDLQRAQEAADGQQGVRAYSDFRALLRDEQLDCVHVITPPATHAALAIEAMEAGCHVLVEKPMALSVQDADRMISAAHAKGVKLGTNHTYLYKPSIQRARLLVESGAIGQLLRVDAYYGLSDERPEVPPGGHWSHRLPGGVFTDYLPHLIYLQLAFLREIEGVAGVAMGYGKGHDEPPTELTACLQGPQACGTLTISTLAKPYAKFIDIYGTRGIIHADLARELCSIHRQWRWPTLVGKALFTFEDSAQLLLGTVANTTKLATGRMERMGEFSGCIASFYRHILKDEQPPVAGEDGRKVISVMEEIWSKAPARSPRPTQRPLPRQPADPRTEVERQVKLSRALSERVLVTGATGFLGRHLVVALARCGASVVALVRDRDRASRDLECHASLVQGNICDRAALAAALDGVRVVFHCAAATHNNLPWRVHKETNIDGTRVVLEEALKAGVRRLVHVSSIIVYGLDEPPGSALIDEQAPYAASRDPWAHYLRSKIEADRLALDLHRTRDLPVTVIRPGTIYGPGRGHSLGRGLIQLGALRACIGPGRNTLRLAYVDNVVDAMLLAATTPEAIGQAYNIVDEPQISAREWMLHTASLVGERVVLLPVPPLVLSGGAAVLELGRNRSGSDTPPRLSRFVVQSSCANLRYSTSKAKEQLGWRPAVSWPEGMAKALNGVA